MRRTGRNFGINSPKVRASGPRPLLPSVFLGRLPGPPSKTKLRLRSLTRSDGKTSRKMGGQRTTAPKRLARNDRPVASRAHFVERAHGESYLMSANATRAPAERRQSPIAAAAAAAAISKGQKATDLRHRGVFASSNVAAPVVVLALLPLRMI